MKAFLLLISLSILFAKGYAQFASTNCDTLRNYSYEKARYRTSADVMGNHLSGILVFKKVSDEETRVVFLNELGTTFFDVSFYEDSYRYHYVLKSMNKKSVKVLLAKDLGMLLMKGIYKQELSHKDGFYYRALKKKGFVMYEADSTCKPIRIYNYAPNKKKIVSVQLTQENNLPNAQKISIEHHTFRFQLSMTFLPDAEE